MIPQVRRLLPLSAFLVVLWGGCAGPFGYLFRANPIAKITPQAVEYSTAALVPGSLTTRETETKIPLLPGSTVTISTEPKAAQSEAANLSPTAIPSVTLTEKTSHASGPVNFQPPAPPSAVEQAEASGTRIFYWLAALCGVGAIALVYLQHYRAAGILIAAAVSVPILLRVGQIVLASHLLTALSALAAGLIVAYYVLRSHPEFIAEAKAHLETLKSRLP